MPALHDDLDMQIVSPAELSRSVRRQMYELMVQNYDGTDWQKFNQDLDEKQFVMLGSDEGLVRGFTTWRCFEQHANSEKVIVLFSGDTIIESGYRGNPFWSMMWLRQAMALADQTDGPLWWMLTSKGYLTYRYLPIWFKEFFPRYDQVPSTEVISLLDCLGRRYGAEHYDASRNVLRCRDGQRLRRGVAEPDDKARANPHVRFFLERNDDWRNGDELVCIARLARDNLRGALAKRLDRTETPQ